MPPNQTGIITKYSPRPVTGIRNPAGNHLISTCKFFACTGRRCWTENGRNFSTGCEVGDTFLAGTTRADSTVLSTVGDTAPRRPRSPAGGSCRSIEIRHDVNCEYCHFCTLSISPPQDQTRRRSGLSRLIRDSFPCTCCLSICRHRSPVWPPDALLLFHYLWFLSLILSVSLANSWDSVTCEIPVSLETTGASTQPLFA